MLSKEEIEGFGVNALDNLDIKMDCVIVAVAHDAFKKMKLEDLARIMNDKSVLVDVRDVFDGEKAEEMGIWYKGLRGFMFEILDESIDILMIRGPAQCSESYDLFWA